MANERDARRLMYLQALDQRSELEPYEYWDPHNLVEGYTDPQIQDALNYLEQKGLAEVLHAGGDFGLSAARITAFGQDFLSTAQSYTNDPTLGGLARATITVHHNTTNITGSTVGTLASGGSGHTLSGNVTIINHPQAEALTEALQRLGAGIEADATLPAHIKEEAGEGVEAVTKELAKPESEQNQEKIKHRWERVSTLVASAPPLLELMNTAAKVLFLSHGG